MAVRTSCHKLSGLKQHNFFYFSVLQKSKTGWQAGFFVCLFFGGLRGEPNSFSFPASRSCLHFLAGGPASLWPQLPLSHRLL